VTRPSAERPAEVLAAIRCSMGYGEPVPNPRWEKHHDAIIITGCEVEPVKVQARPIPGCEVELGRARAEQCVDLGNHVALYNKHDQRFEAQPMALEVLDTRTPAVIFERGAEAREGSKYASGIVRFWP